MAGALLLALGGCAGSGGPDGALSESQAERTVEAALRDVEDIYYRETKASALVNAGLEGIHERYPAVVFSHEGDAIVATVDGNPIHRVAMQDDSGAATEWAEEVAPMLVRISAALPGEDKPDLADLTDTFLDSIVDSLDGRSHYASKDDAKQWGRRNTGQEGTLDLALEPADGGWKIVHLFSVHLLHSSELQRGDVVVAVNGIPTTGLSEAGVVELTTGPLGSFVTLTIQRVDDIGPFDVTLELKKWASESFRTEMIDTSAVIALARLDDETLNEVRYQAARVSSHDSGRSPVVLDLRGNIGGLLEPSLAIADLFLNNGRIISTQGRHVDSHHFFEASDVPALDAPIIVLIDEFTAAGAEIVVAALQDNARAVVVGSVSYGRGTIQTALPLPNSGFLALSWTEVITPAGYRLDQRGVMPMICTGGDATTEEVLAALRSGGGVIDRATRTRDVDPDDAAAVAALRALCPPRSDRADVSLEVARALLADPALFSQVLAAAGQ